VGLCSLVDGQGEAAEFGSVFSAHQLFGGRKVDVFIVGAVLALGGGSKHGLGRREPSSRRRQRNSADRSARLILLPARTGQVAARHALQGNMAARLTSMERPSNCSA